MSKRRRSTALSNVQESTLNSQFVKPQPASTTDEDPPNVEAVQPVCTVTFKKPKTKKGDLSVFNILQSFILGNLEGLDDENLRRYILNDDAARERWVSTWHNEALLFTHNKNRQRMVDYLEKIIYPVPCIASAKHIPKEVQCTMHVRPLQHSKHSLDIAQHSKQNKTS